MAPPASTSAGTPLTSIRLPLDQPFEEARYVEIIDQLLLPHEIRWQKVASPTEAFEAIKSMKVRPTCSMDGRIVG